MKSARVAVLTGTALLVIGTALFGNDVKVDGIVEAGGGFKFPDGSIQGSAAGEYDKVFIVGEVRRPLHLDPGRDRQRLQRARGSLSGVRGTG